MLETIRPFNERVDGAIEGLVEKADDASLIHSRAAMVEELVRTFLARLTASGPRDSAAVSRCTAPAGSAAMPPRQERAGCMNDRHGVIHAAWALHSA